MRPVISNYNHELNLAHKTVLSEDEVLSDKPVLSDQDRASLLNLSPEELEERRKLKSSVGAHAIAELDLWFEKQWQAAKDLKDLKADLIELLDASKFGEKEYTPYQIYMKTLYEHLKDELSEDERQAFTRSTVELTEFQQDAVRKARKILSRYDGVTIADSVRLDAEAYGEKVILLTATPINNNDLMDLYHQINLFTRGNNGYFVAAGSRRLKTEYYNLEQTYHGIYDQVVRGIEGLQRAGRIDRIGADFDTSVIYNMFPDEGLERLLKLAENLQNKIASSQEDQASLQAVPRSTDPLQQTVAALLQSLMNRPDVSRPEVVTVLRYLQRPLTGVEVKELRGAYQIYLKTNDAAGLVEACLDLVRRYDGRGAEGPGLCSPARITRADLRLICFDLLS